MTENVQNRNQINTDELAIKTESLNQLILLMNTMTTTNLHAHGIGTIMPSEEEIHEINQVLDRYEQLISLLPAMTSLINDIHNITFQLPDEVFWS